jgi:ribosomal protein L12E/L44/L45/RPP1/RPP2
VILAQHERRLIAVSDDIDHALTVQQCFVTAKETRSRSTNAQRCSYSDSSSSSSSSSSSNSINGGNSTGHDEIDDDSTYSNSGSDDDEDDDDDDDDGNIDDSDDGGEKISKAGIEGCDEGSQATKYISITSREINKDNCAEDPSWEDPGGGELDIFIAALQEALIDLGYFSNFSTIVMLDIEAMLYLLYLTKDSLGLYLRNVNTSHLARYGSPLNHLQFSFQQSDGVNSGEMSIVSALQSINTQLQTQIARLSLEDVSHSIKSDMKSAPPSGATVKRNLSIYNAAATPLPREGHMEEEDDEEEEDEEEEEKDDKEGDDVSSVTKKKRKRGPVSADSRSKRSKDRQRYDKRPTPFRPSENFFTPFDSGRSSLSSLTSGSGSSSTQAASSSSSASSAASEESVISPYCDMIQPKRSSRGVSENGPKRKLLFAGKNKTQ